MPRTKFTPENKSSGSGFIDYPKLKLAFNELARGVIMEVDPVTEYVHTVRVPVLDDLGKPVMEWKKAGQKEREVMKRAFVGRHRCFGDFDTVKANGIDPANCVSCEAAKNGEGIEPPQQYVGVHLFQYNCKANSFQPTDPLSGQLVAWVLTGKRWNELIDLCVEYGKDVKQPDGPVIRVPADIRTLDLMLGPCENVDFQNFKIQGSTKSRWLADPVAQKFVSESYRNNKCPDLAPLFAQVKTIDQVREDLRVVASKYEIMNGHAPASGTAADYAGITASVEDILAEVMDTPPTAVEQGTQQDFAAAALDDVLGEVTDTAPLAEPEPTPPPAAKKAPAKKAPAKAAAPAAPAPEPVADDLSSLASTEAAGDEAAEGESANWDDVLASLNLT